MRLGLDGPRAPVPKAHAPRVPLKGRVPMVEGTSRCLGGEGNLPLAAGHRRLDLLGCAPPPLGTPIYSEGEEES